MSAHPGIGVQTPHLLRKHNFFSTNNSPPRAIHVLLNWLCCSLLPWADSMAGKVKSLCSQGLWSWQIWLKLLPAWTPNSCVKTRSALLENKGCWNSADPQPVSRCLTGSPDGSRLKATPTWLTCSVACSKEERGSMLSVCRNSCLKSRGIKL